MLRTKTIYPALRLVARGETLEQSDSCKDTSFSAAPPLGSNVRSCSMSLTDEAANPMRSPISASVNPVTRRSEMRDAQVVIGPSLLRPAVESRRRLPVTDIRENVVMPRPPGLPKFDALGPRIRWWREHRKFKRAEFAKLVGMSYSGLADLENDRSQESKRLHLIAAKLKLNPYYLETDKGEPEAEFTQEPPATLPEWPFQSVPLDKLNKLNRIERSYAETKLLEALAEIEAERRRAKKTG